jgi:site-specific DNA-methyltransferase (adenine-specific)
MTASGTDPEAPHAPGENPVCQLQPLCGCGTAIDAAQSLGRQWIGIDITFIAVDLIEKRLLDRYPAIADTYETFGIPLDTGASQALFERSPVRLRAVSRLPDQRPAQREARSATRGVDGVARFYLDKKTTSKVVVP